MSDAVIETDGLTKSYDGLTAVDGLDLTVTEGEVFGVLGPNGSGKTTTILMLLGLTEPTSGTARVLGLDPARRPLDVKARVGYLPEQVGFYEDLTARENLAYIARLNGIPRRDADARIDDALDRIGLSEAADREVKGFSRGMRQRLGLAEILVKRPDVVILDEPTLGLDPQAAIDLLETIRGLKDEGITIMLASHLLYQVQAICDRVGLFHRGEVVLEGTVTDLARNILGGAYRISLEAEGPDLSDALRSIDGVLGVERTDDGRYVLESEHDLRAQVAEQAVEAGGRLHGLGISEPSLDEVYAEYFRKEKEGASHGRSDAD